MITLELTEREALVLAITHGVGGVLFAGDADYLAVESIKMLEGHERVAEIVQMKLNVALGPVPNLKRALLEAKEEENVL